MRKFIATVAALLLSGCAPYMEANLFHNFQEYGGNDVALIEAGFERRWSTHTTAHCSFYHLSNPSRGRPFNDKWEHVLMDGLGCGVRVGGAR